MGQNQLPSAIPSGLPDGDPVQFVGCSACPYTRPAAPAQLPAARYTEPVVVSYSAPAVRVDVWPINSVRPSAQYGELTLAVGTQSPSGNEYA